MMLASSVAMDEVRLFAFSQSPRSHGNRAFALGRIYSRDGTLVASVAQEGVVRMGSAKSSSKEARPKL